MDSSSDAKAHDHQGPPSTMSHCHRQPWPSMLGVPPSTSSTMAHYNLLPYPAPQYQRNTEAEEGKNAYDNWLAYPPKTPYPLTCPSMFRTEEGKNAYDNRLAYPPKCPYPLPYPLTLRKVENENYNMLGLPPLSSLPTLPPSESKQDQRKRPRIGSDDDGKYPVRGFDNPMGRIYAFNPLLQDLASMLPLPQDKRVEGVPIRRGGYPNDYDIFLIDPNDSEKIYVKVDPDEWEKYQKQRKISEGFEVDYYKWMAAWLVRPVLDLEDDYDFYRQYVQMALDQYNQHHNKGGTVELVKILRFNQECFCDNIKYMTFIAKDACYWHGEDLSS